MRILSFILFFFCYSFGNCQDIFRTFHDLENELDSLISKDSLRAYELFSSLDALLNEIEAENIDSATIFRFRCYSFKHYFFNKNPLEMIDSLDFYSRKMVEITEGRKDTFMLVEALRPRAFYYHYKGLPDESLRLMGKALKLSMLALDTTLICQACAHHLYFLMVKGKGVDQDSIIKECLPYSKGLSMRHKMYFFGTIAEAKMELQNYVESYHYFQKAITIANIINDPNEMVRLYVPVVDLHLYMHEPLKAIEFCKKALSMEAKISRMDLGLLYGALAQAYNSPYHPMKNIDSVDYYIQLASNEFILSHDSMRLFTLAGIKADVLIAKNDYAEAIQVLLNGINYGMEYGYDTQVQGYYNALGNCYNEMGQYALAISYLDKGMKYVREIGYPQFWISYSNSLSFAYKKLGNHEKSLEYKEIEIEYIDSLYKKEKIEELAQLETQFEIKIHEQEKGSLKEKLKQEQTINQKNKSIQKKDRKIKRLLASSTLGSVLTLSLAILVLAFRNRSKKRQIELNNLTIQNHQLNEKALKDKLAILKERLVLESKAGYDYEQQKGTEIDHESYLSKKIKEDSNWRDFMKDFNAIYNGLLDKLQRQYIELTNNELRLIALVKLKLRVKEMSELLVVSDWGIHKSKSRVRDKLGLQKSTEIPAFIDQFMDDYC